MIIEIENVLSMYPSCKKWYLTGHSRGGAIGLCLQQMLIEDVSLITFGSPRVFKRGAKLKGEHIRIHNKGDSVTNVPPWIFGYRHFGLDLELMGKFFKADHPIDEYIDRLSGESEIEMRRRWN